LLEPLSFPRCSQPSFVAHAFLRATAPHEKMPQERASAVGRNWKRLSPESTAICDGVRGVAILDSTTDKNICSHADDVLPRPFDQIRPIARGALSSGAAGKLRLGDSTRAIARSRRPSGIAKRADSLSSRLTLRDVAALMIACATNSATIHRRPRFGDGT